MAGIGRGQPAEARPARGLAVAVARRDPLDDAGESSEQIGGGGGERRRPDVAGPVRLREQPLRRIVAIGRVVGRSGRRDVDEDPAVVGVADAGRIDRVLAELGRRIGVVALASPLGEDVEDGVGPVEQALARLLRPDPVDPHDARAALAVRARGRLADGEARRRERGVAGMGHRVWRGVGRRLAGRAGWGRGRGLPTGAAEALRELLDG